MMSDYPPISGAYFRSLSKSVTFAEMIFFESCCLLRDLTGEGRVIVEIDEIEAEVGIGVEGVTPFAVGRDGPPVVGSDGNAFFDRLGNFR